MLTPVPAAVAVERGTEGNRGSNGETEHEQERTKGREKGKPESQKARQQRRAERDAYRPYACVCVSVAGLLEAVRRLSRLGVPLTPLEVRMADASGIMALIKRVSTACCGARARVGEQRGGLSTGSMSNTWCGCGRCCSRRATFSSLPMLRTR